MPKEEIIGQTGAVTGFDTPDPKDTDPDTIYTTTPADDRVGSADRSTYQPVSVPDAREVTGQFDHLATRDPAAMEHQLQPPEFEGAASTIALGDSVAMLDAVVPGDGLGASMTMSPAVIGQHVLSAADQNPNYTPPSQMTPPHLSEQVHDLPSDAERVIEQEIKAQVEKEENL